MRHARGTWLRLAAVIGAVTGVPPGPNRAAAQRRPTAVANALPTVAAQSQGFCTSLEWQPGGDRLACAGDERRPGVLLIAPDGTRTVIAPSDRSGTPRWFQEAFEWSRDGRTLVASVGVRAGATSSVQVVRATFDGRPPRSVHGERVLGLEETSDGWRRSETPVFGTIVENGQREEAAVLGRVTSPDGATIALLLGNPAGAQFEGRYQTSLRPAGATGPERPLRAVRARGLTVRWSPDSQWIAQVHQTADGLRTVLSVYERARANAAPRVLARDLTAAAVAWSPDSREVAASRRRGGVTELVAYRLDGRPPRVLAVADSRDCDVLTPTWSPTRGLAFMHWCGRIGMPSAVRIVRVP